MKTHEFDLCGQRLHLLLNGQALFDLYDKFGTDGFLTDALDGSGKLRRVTWLQLLTQFLRLGVREGMLLTPGEVLDLQELEITRRGLKREGE